MLSDFISSVSIDVLSSSLNGALDKDGCAESLLQYVYLSGWGGVCVCMFNSLIHQPLGWSSGNMKRRPGLCFGPIMPLTSLTLFYNA